MRNVRVDSITLIYVLFLVGYPTSVLAAQNIFQDTTGFSLYQALYAVFMGFWGALACFTEKYSKGGQNLNWLKLILASMSNSTLAAAVAFMICVHAKISPALTGAVCALAGYGGARFLAWAYKRFLAKADKLLEGMD